jgi:hypothetical protein
MSGVRWSPTGNEAPPDPRRRALFDDWCETGVVQYGITLDDYARMRMEGRWNEYAREHLRGRFMVEEVE